VSACGRALNDTQLSTNICVQIRHAAHHGDHPRLVALFVQCERDNEIQGATLQAFLASRVSAGPSTSSVNADRFFQVEAAAADREHTRASSIQTTFFPSMYASHLPFPTF